MLRGVFVATWHEIKNHIDKLVTCYMYELYTVSLSTCNHLFSFRCRCFYNLCVWYTLTTRASIISKKKKCLIPSNPAMYLEFRMSSPTKTGEPMYTDCGAVNYRELRSVNPYWIGTHLIDEFDIVACSFHLV